MDEARRQLLPVEYQPEQPITHTHQTRCDTLLVVLLAGSGLRIGEALGLNVSDVDFLRRTLKVARQRLPSGRIGPPKTIKSAGTVPLGQVVIDELAAHLAAYPSDGPLFVLATGKPLAYRTWRSIWAHAAEVEAKAVRTRLLRLGPMPKRFRWTSTLPRCVTSMQAR